MEENKVIKWYQDDNGNTSILRIMIVPIISSGIILVLAGTVAMFLSNSLAIPAITAGAGIISATLAAKVWQKTKE